MIGLMLVALCGAAIIGLVMGARWLEQATWRREVVVFALRFPRALSADQVVTFLSSLPPASRLKLLGPAPLGLEVLASSAGIEHRLLLASSEVDGVTAQLQAALPGIRMERIKEGEVKPVGLAAELRLRSGTFPLASERVEAASAAVLSSLLPLDDGETIQLQWLLRGAVVPGVPRLTGTRDSSAGWLDADGVADSEELRGLRRKQAELLLQAVGRVGVSAPTAARRVQLLARVLAGLSVMDAPGVRVRSAVLPPAVAGRRLMRRSMPLLAWPVTINTREAAGLLGIPVGELDLPGLDLGGARQLPVNPGTLNQGVLLGESDHPGTLGRELRLETSDRLRHLHLIGPTGTGKSTLMARMVLEDLEAGHGLVVVDPKRDLVEAILARVPASRRNDVVVLDPTDTDRPVGLNVLARQGDSEAERELVAEHLLGVFQNLWEDSWGPRSDDILRASLLTLCSARAANGSAFTLVELPELLTVTRFRKFVLAQDTVSEHVRGFWQWFEQTSPWERSQALAPVLNKVRAFTMRTPVRLLLGQPEGFDLRRVVTERQVVLVPLSAGELGQPAAELLGSLMVAAVWQTIRGRTAMAADRRAPVLIYLDEFQDVLRLPLELADLLAQARGLGAGLTLAHQHLGQLPKDVRSAVLATARSQAVFQVAPDDARVLARGFAPSLGEQDLGGLEAFHFALRPVWQGQNIRAVTGRTLPLPDGQDGSGLRSTSRERFGTPRAAVEAALKARLKAADAERAVPLGRRRKGAA